eukprot:Phypoly_transcript_22531.p1 GENE.Phypoly_transcript_22531~~Phypoly_transcript_22531.p1  ORF type:complete len:159 (+),score=30.57 Phypoly_transcript_22531:94-570(+)
MSGVTTGKYSSPVARGEHRVRDREKEKVKFQIKIHSGEICESANAYVKICKAKRWEGGKGIRNKTLVETPVHYNTRNPTWDYVDEFVVSKEAGGVAHIKVELLDKEGRMRRSDVIGSAVVALNGHGDEKIIFTEDIDNRSGEPKVAATVFISYKQIFV